MAGADVQISGRSLPGAFELTDKIIATVKRWASEAKILGKDVKLLPAGSTLEGLEAEAKKNTIVLTPDIQFILRLTYPWGAGDPYSIWADFPRDSDHFFLQFKKYVGAQYESKVTAHPNLRRQFILEFLRHSALTGLDRHFNLGGRKAFYWEFHDTLYYDGLTKDHFFRRYRSLGASAHYLHAFFAQIFLGDDAGKRADSHLYL